MLRKLLSLVATGQEETQPSSKHHARVVDFSQIALALAPEQPARGIDFASRCWAAYICAVEPPTVWMAAAVAANISLACSLASMNFLIFARSGQGKNGGYRTVIAYRHATLTPAAVWPA